MRSSKTIALATGERCFRCWRAALELAVASVRGPVCYCCSFAIAVKQIEQIDMNMNNGVYIRSVIIRSHASRMSSGGPGR